MVKVKATCRVPGPGSAGPVVACAGQTVSEMKLLYLWMFLLRISEQGPSTRSKRGRSSFTHLRGPRATTVAARGRFSSSAISPRRTGTAHYTGSSSRSISAHIFFFSLRILQCIAPMIFGFIPRCIATGQAKAGPSACTFQGHLKRHSILCLSTRPNLSPFIVFTVLNVLVSRF